MALVCSPRLISYCICSLTVLSELQFTITLWSRDSYSFIYINNQIFCGEHKTAGAKRQQSATQKKLPQQSCTPLTFLFVLSFLSLFVLHLCCFLHAMRFKYFILWLFQRANVPTNCAHLPPSFSYFYLSSLQSTRLNCPFFLLNIFLLTLVCICVSTLSSLCVGGQRTKVMVLKVWKSVWFSLPWLAL